MQALIRRALVLTGLADRLQDAALLALRLYVSAVFFKSGLVKISDWGATLALFHDEYKVPLLPPDVAACAGAFGELAFPVLIALGLAGRFGAAGLFVVNAMAVLSYPQLWGFDCPAGIQMHFVWGGILLLLALFGPGRLSLDELILRRMGGRHAPVACPPRRCGPEDSVESLAAVRRPANARRGLRSAACPAAPHGADPAGQSGTCRYGRTTSYSSPRCRSKPFHRATEVR